MADHALHEARLSPGPAMEMQRSASSSGESVEKIGSDEFGPAMSTAELQRSLKTRSILLPATFDPYLYGGSQTSSEVTTKSACCAKACPSRRRPTPSTATSSGAPPHASSRTCCHASSR